MGFKILIINGPNLNLLGQREQSQYGLISYDELKDVCMKKSSELDIKLEFVQSNLEGEIVTWIQEAKEKQDGIIINAAGFTHTSVSIRDALLLFDKTKIELHISNIYKREEFRKKSFLSDISDGVIVGCGTSGYEYALLEAIKRIEV